MATHLYVGTIVSGATFKWAAGTAIGPANFQQLGTNAETTFLQDYETTTGFTSAVAGTGPTPKPFFTITIGSGQLATGEIAIENLSAPTAFFLYADGVRRDARAYNFMHLMIPTFAAVSFRARRLRSFTTIRRSCTIITEGGRIGTWGDPRPGRLQRHTP